MPIRVLAQTLINQIAAGEVIVRMANVVKEMVENSIDAGATRIEVIVENDVRDVQVRDNGCGMDRDDAEMCLQRHATSKIKDVDDLFNLHTRGFRGEAIPSIASVSRMEIRTRPEGAISGTRVVVEGGRIERIEPIGCPTGTHISVRDLFFNTKPRLKFLKSTVSEMNSVMTMITRQALAQPDVGFRVERDGRTIMDVPPDQSPPERFASILGSQLKGDVLEIGFARGTVQVTGIMAHPHDARGDRRSQFFFVNKRPFVAKALTGALEQACKGYVMTSRFPIAAVFIDIPPEDVDFNVHPTKEEVRFRDERFVAGTVYHAVKGALEGSAAMVGEVRLAEGDAREDDTNGSVAASPDRPEAPPQQSPPPPPGFFSSPEQLVRRVFDKKQASARMQTDLLVERERQANTRAPEWEPAFSPPMRPLRRSTGEVIAAGPGERPNTEFWTRGIEPEPLGQVALTYIMVRYGNDLLIIDQHAVHERLVYLELKRKQRRIDKQSLMIPITVELDPAQSETIRELLPHFDELGFELSEFGPRTWAVNSLPVDLPEFDPVPLIIETIGDLEESRRGNALETMRDKILIRTACHGAIRAGDALTLEQMRELLKQVKAERLSFTCPHGRPTIVRLSKDELDRQFKRVV